MTREVARKLRGLRLVLLFAFLACAVFSPVTYRWGYVSGALIGAAVTLEVLVACATKERDDAAP